MREKNLLKDIQKIDWQAIELLNDILFDTLNPSERLQQALSFLVERMGYSQAALLVQSEGDDLPKRKVYCQIPGERQNLFEDPRSRLIQLAQQVVHSRMVILAEPELGLAGAFPLEYQNEVLGVLLVFGLEISKDDLQCWLAFTRAIARAIHTWNITQNRFSPTKDIGVLDALLSLQKEHLQDISVIEQKVLEQVRELYLAQDALLILFEDSGSSLVLHRQLAIGGQWVERRSMVPEDSHHFETMCRSLHETGVVHVLPEFTRWLSLVSEINVTGSLCTALWCKEQLLGGLVIINPTRAENEVPPALFEMISSFLSNAIETSREVTSLKISVADLEANRWEIINSRNTLLTFFDSIPASVYIIDRGFTLISINLRRSGRLSKHPNILVGRKCYEQLYNRIDPCPACRVMETLRNSTITNRISREWEDLDRFVEWEITTFPIQESDHLPHRVIIFEEDVTEKRNLEANLIQSEKLASVGQLAAGVAHEINNPLAAIIANAQLIKRDMPKDDDNYPSVELIEMAGLRAAQVVSNLLSLARKEKKNEFELVSLNETIQNALTLVGHEIKNHSIDIQLDLEEDIPEIMASRNHLQGVWINMIVNSIDSIDQSNGHISITTRYLNNEFRVVIADNGKGIPQEYLSRVFEPFFTTKVAGKGTGLGLSVCYRVIKEHQGNIVVESQNNLGTKFTITLPNLVRRN
jgi:signal transduction histidine kinase